jgi:hypothetical protein
VGKLFSAIDACRSAASLNQCRLGSGILFSKPANMEYGRICWETNRRILGAAGRPKWKFQVTAYANKHQMLSRLRAQVGQIIRHKGGLHAETRFGTNTKGA